MQSRASSTLPESIGTEEELDELLTAPRPSLIEFLRTLQGPLLILGAGGKMGPTLAVLARRAARAAGAPVEVIAASRFTDAAGREWLEARGVRTIHCDLLDREALRRLPDSANVIYLAGLKFGTSSDPSRTWAVNTLAPANVAERFPRSRIAALSSGNVYGLAPVASGGSVETDPLEPAGEYAGACLARERIFEFCSRQAGTPMVLIRLNYAVELRYGVLTDIARKVQAGEPVDVTMGYLNCIWQGDASEMTIRALALAASPPSVLNVTGERALSVRELALAFGRLLGQPARVTGSESATALLGNPARACSLLGAPATPLDEVRRWTAEWIRAGGRLLNKPTHFEVRDGRY